MCTGIKAKHFKCNICGRAMNRTENENWVCNSCDLVFFIQIVGKPNKENEVNRIGG